MSFNSIIQKDVPLISWRLDEADGSTTLSSDRFMVGYNATASTGITTKKTPIIFGSPSSIILSSGTIKFPSLGTMTNRYRHQPMSLEFWVKPISGLGTSSRTQIVQLASTATGVYVENSSFIAIIGSSLLNCKKIVVPVENFNKPFHIVMTYNESSFGFYVNGQGSTVPIEKGIFTDVWSDFTSGSTEKQKLENANQFFYFKSISGKPYALDNVAIYGYDMDINLAKRHMVYGLGYEAPIGFEDYFGGYRYNLSMVESNSVGRIEKFNGDSWMGMSETNNMISENGVMRINNLPYPELKSTSDSAAIPWTWNANGLQLAKGSYLQIYPKQIDPLNNGFAVVYNSIIGTGIQNLLLLQDSLNPEYSIRVYLEGRGVYCEINGGQTQTQNGSSVTKVTLKSTAGSDTSTNFTVGYFYDNSLGTLRVFYADSSTNSYFDFTSEASRKIFTTSHASVLRIGSNDVFSDNDLVNNITDADIQLYAGYISKIVHLESMPGTTGIFNTVNTAVNKYLATANSSEGRFIIRAKGKIKFKVDAKRLAGANGIIGPNKIEWGYDGTELTVKAKAIGAESTGYVDYDALLNAFSGGTYQDVYNTHTTYSQLLNNPESNWFNSGNLVTLYNRSCFSDIVGENAGVTKAVEFTMDVDCIDVIDNPVKITFFRLISYEASAVGTTHFVSEIKTNTLPFKYTFTKTNRDFNLPEYKTTPFLWCEEDGGFKVGRTAFIEYKSAPVYGESAGGLGGIAFFLNIPTTTSRSPLLTIKKGSTTVATISYNGTNLTCSGGQIFLNGSTSGSTSVSYTTGTWQHVVLKLTSISTVTESSYPIITFGVDSGVSDFYIDEIVTFSDATTEEIGIMTKIYRSVYIEDANDDIGFNELFFDDTEIANDTEIYQPFPGQTSLQVDVDLATYSSKKLAGTSSNLTFTYTGPNSLLIDNTYLQDGERILIKNQKNETIDGVVTSTSQNGIFTIAIPDDLEPNVTVITLTRQSCPDGSVIYVKDGVSNKGRHFLKNSNSSFEETYIVKKVDAYVYEGSPQKTEIVARKTITV